MTDPATFPGAEAPQRTYRVNSSGVFLQAYEWGDENAPPLMLVHGGFDFARTYDGFAPLLAKAGWRVVAWDQRGHGASEHAPLYNWDADVRDAVAVMDSVTTNPLPVVGHSKGGSLMLQLADIAPWRISKLVNLDGLPSHRQAPDISGYERTRMLADEMASWLDHQRRAHQLSRKPGTLEELAARRGNMNPRLSKEWLLYLAAVGASKSDDGYRWTIDPALRMGGFGPYRPDWSLKRLSSISMPLFGVLSTIEEPMGWGTSLADVEPHLPYGGRVIEMPDTGHFLHIERPQAVADLVLEFLS